MSGTGTETIEIPDTVEEFTGFAIAAFICPNSSTTEA